MQAYFYTSQRNTIESLCWALAVVIILSPVHYPHLFFHTGWGTETQRSKVACSRPHSLGSDSHAFRPWFVWFQNLCPFHSKHTQSLLHHHECGQWRAGRQGPSTISTWAGTSRGWAQSLRIASVWLVLGSSWKWRRWWSSCSTLVLTPECSLPPSWQLHFPLLPQRCGSLAGGNRETATEGSGLGGSRWLGEDLEETGQ